MADRTSARVRFGFVVSASAKGIALRSLQVEVRGSPDLAGLMNLREDADIKMLGLQYNIVVDSDAPAEKLA